MQKFKAYGHKETFQSFVYVVNRLFVSAVCSFAQLTAKEMRRKYWTNRKLYLIAEPKQNILLLAIKEL